MTKIKTIDVQAKEWLDRINGNSYFAGVITVNYGMKDERVYKMPYQYGYSDAYIYEARNILIEKEKIKCHNTALWSYCKDNGIILRTNKQANCKKSELKNI